MTPWWDHWYVMIPAVLALWGFGVAIGRVQYQRYIRKVESGEVQPTGPPPRRVPCEDGCELESFDNRYPCLMGCRLRRFGIY